MDNSAVQLVGSPCGQHGPYTFYKAFKYVKNGLNRLVKLSEFFFVKLWTDSDLVCIGELQLLWIDKNSEQVLSSLRLYFLPENTPEGRMDHGEDEVLAISEKVVLRLEDLVTWITTDAEWTWGRLARWEADVKEPKYSENEKEISNVSVNEGILDFSDVEKEKEDSVTDEKLTRSSVIILSYPSYCRYRGIIKRLEGVEEDYLKHTVVKVLGGFTAVNKNTRVLFCRDTFDYPELEGHELLCNHLAPKLKGRPRGRRKKRSLSPGSESNESESSVCNILNSRTRLMAERASNGLRSDKISTRQSTRVTSSNLESKEFLKTLTAYMKSIQTPIGRIPSLGFKELDLYAFFTKVNKLGGYDSVTRNRLWKSIFDDLSGNYMSTSAATVIRRHYERFLLPYELHLKGEEYNSSSKNSKCRSGSCSDSSDSPSGSGKSTPISQLTVIPLPPTDSTEISQLEQVDKPKLEVKTSSLRSVRVKPERLRDHVPKDGAAAPSDKCANTDITNSRMVNELSVEIKTEVETSSTKISESNLLNNGLTVELITTALPTIPQKSSQNEVSEIVSDKISKTSAPIESSIKTEQPQVCLDSAPKSDGDKSDDGKENIATCNTNSVSNAQNRSTESDLSEVPCKSKTPESVQLDTDYRFSATSSVSKSLLHSVKKRKLDILKEGGLEVTPIKPSTNELKEIKETRPSVIHHNHGMPKATVGQLSITLATDKPASSNSMEMSERLLPTSHAKDIQTLPSTSIMRSNPISINRSISSSPNNSFLYLNGQSPPKVVQSRSIYSYSEKTVYGNPKDYFMPPPRPPVQIPKPVGGLSRHLGGDILDLTTKSPQKAVVEIMRVPNVPTSRAQFGMPDIPQKKVFKNSASLPVLDTRVASNLEITLVGSNTISNVQQNSRLTNRTHSFSRPRSNTVIPSLSSASNVPKSYGTYNFNSKTAQKRTFNGNYVSNNKKEENGKLPYLISPTQQAYAPRDHRQQNNVSNSYSNHRIPTQQDNRNQAKAISQSSPNIKPYTPPTSSSVLPPYLSQLSLASKMVPPYVPPIDPLYFSALQSLYPHSPLSSAVPPFFPVPSPDHLQFYTDLIARHSQMRYPFPFSHDGNASIPPASTESNNFKQQ